MRLAWFTPWPPQPSGIAGRSVETTRLLCDRGWGIDVSVDQRQVPVPSRPDDDPVAPGTVRLQPAQDFVWRQARGQYDLVVYQVGNSRHHDFMWPYLFQFPGLVVLHDLRLHHARARRLQTIGGVAAYRAEFAFDHPEVSGDAAELAVHGFDGRYYSQWPMTRAVIESARSVAVHTRGGRTGLAEMYPNRAVKYLPLGGGRERLGPSDGRARFRRAHGVDQSTIVFGAFGGLSADKRITEILRAFAFTRRRHPGVRLWLAGAPDSQTDLRALLTENGVQDAVTHFAELDDEAFDDAIAAVDVSLNLRWPSAMETSGPWVRALSMGRPSVVVELPHQADIPALDPRDWRARNPADPRPPVTVAIDILDEQHSLVLAMDRLAGDASLRERLGSSARRYWEAEHTPTLVADGYEAVLKDAMSRPVPAINLPETLRPDVWRRSRTLASAFGIDRCELP